MLTAVNGILIVVLLFAFGAVVGDKRIMAAALASAGLSWLVNAAEATNRDTAKGLLPFFAIVVTCIGYALVIRHLL